MEKIRLGVSAWEIDRTIVRFPDPAIEVVDERFRSLVVWQEVVERLWTGRALAGGSGVVRRRPLSVVFRHP